MPLIFSFGFFVTNLNVAFFTYIINALVDETVVGASVVVPSIVVVLEVVDLVLVVVDWVVVASVVVVRVVGRYSPSIKLPVTEKTHS